MGHSHQDNKPLGISDVIAGAVIFSCLAAVSAHVAGPEGYGFLRNLLTVERSLELWLSGILFIMVWYVLGVLVVKPYLETLYEREDQTTGLKEQNVLLKKEIEGLKREISAEIKTARLEGIRKRDQKISEAKRLAVQAVDEGRRSADVEWQKRSFELENMKESLLGSIDSQVEDLAGKLYEKVVTPDSSSKVIH